MARSDRNWRVTIWNWIYRVLGRIGDALIGFCGLAVYLVSLMCAVLALTVRPRHWRRTIRQVFSRQLLRMGVSGITPVGSIAFLVGVLVVMQAQLWAGRVGQTEWLGPVLVVVVVRELAPLLTNLIMIVRSGSEVTAELATMTVAGEVRMIDAQGVDPLTYLVMPRVSAMVISTFCLTILFVLLSFFSGYLFSVTVGMRVPAPQIFMDQVLRSLQLADVLHLLVTSLVPPLLTGLICSSEGLSVSPTSTAVPAATRRAMSRSVVSLFLVSVPVSLLTYL